MRHQPSSAPACVRWPALWTWKPLMKDNWKMLVQYIVPGWRPNNGGGEQDNKRNECTDQSNHYPHNHTELPVSGTLDTTFTGAEHMILIHSSYFCQGGTQPLLFSLQPQGCFNTAL